MKLAFVLAMLLIIGIASAESVVMNGYNIEFNMTKPHQLTTLNDNWSLLIKTFDGEIFINPDRGTSYIGEHLNPQTIEIDGQDAYFTTSEASYMANYKKNNKTIEVWSFVSIYDTADFLRSLHIEPVKAMA